MNAQRPEDLGVLTHAILAALAGHAHTVGPHGLAVKAYETARDSFAAFGMHNRTQALLVEATSFASVYLRSYVPPQPWRLLAAEMPTGSRSDDEQGRVDLVWEHPTAGVLFDEIKTTKIGTESVSSRWKAQCNRYVAAGGAEHGARFVGVRLVPLGALHLATFFAPTGGNTALAGTPWHPSSMSEPA